MNKMERSFSFDLRMSGFNSIYNSTDQTAIAKTVFCAILKHSRFMAYATGHENHLCR